MLALMHNISWTLLARINRMNGMIGSRLYLEQPPPRWYGPGHLAQKYPRLHETLLRLHVFT